MSSISVHICESLHLWEGLRDTKAKGRLRARDVARGKHCDEEHFLRMAYGQKVVSIGNELLRRLVVQVKRVKSWSDLLS